MNVKPFVAAALVLLSAAAGAAQGFAPLDRRAAADLADPASHAGPTVVALWSADCIHCKKNFALFAGLARAEPRLKVVTVAVEPVEAAQAEPLDRFDVPGLRFAYGADAPEALAYALDAKWRGELPRTLIFDGRGGKRAVSGIVSEDVAREALGLARK